MSNSRILRKTLHTHSLKGRQSQHIKLCFQDVEYHQTIYIALNFYTMQNFQVRGIHREQKRIQIMLSQATQISHTLLAMHLNYNTRPIWVQPESASICHISLNTIMHFIYHNTLLKTPLLVNSPATHSTHTLADNADCLPPNVHV